MEGDRWRWFVWNYLCLRDNVLVVLAGEIRRVLYCYFKSAVGLLSIKSVGRWLSLFICSEFSCDSPLLFNLTRMHQHLLFLSWWWDTIYLFEWWSCSASVHLHLCTVSLYHIFYGWDIRGTASACHLGRTERSLTGNISKNIINGLGQSSKGLWNAMANDIYLWRVQRPGVR